MLLVVLKRQLLERGLSKRILVQEDVVLEPLVLLLGEVYVLGKGLIVPREVLWLNRWLVLRKTESVVLLDVAEYLALLLWRQLRAPVYVWGKVLKRKKKQF